MVRTGLEDRVKSLEETSQLIRSVPGRLDRVEVRLDRVEVRLDRVEGRLERVEGRLERVEGRLDRVEGRLDRIEARLDDVQAQILRTREELLVAIGATVDSLRIELRAEMRSTAEETRRHMGVLLEHAVAQMHALFDASRQPPQ